jgi:hypothetical protein
MDTSQGPDVFKGRSLRLSAGWLSVVEIVVLVPAAAILVFGAVPSAFDVEWTCIGPTGTERTAGDTYLAGVAILMTFGWLLVLVASVYAEIAERPRVAALLPVLWFVAVVAISLVAAAAIGPELCPAQVARAVTA